LLFFLSLLRKRNKRACTFSVWLRLKRDRDLDFSESETSKCNSTGTFAILSATLAALSYLTSAVFVSALLVDTTALSFRPTRSQLPMIICHICRDDSNRDGSVPVTLLCGHTFDLECLQRSNRMYIKAGSSPRCPCCRQEFDQVIRLYFPAQSDVPEASDPASPLSEAQLQIAREIEDSCGGVGIESSKTDLETVIGKAENLMLGVATTHGNTNAKSAIEKLENTLQALRNRLRYAARLESLRERLAEEKEDRIRLVEKCNETQRHFKSVEAERNEYLRNAESKMLQLHRLQAMEKQWVEREESHKRTLIEERQRANTSANVREQLVHAVQESNLQRVKVARYKKKYLATKAELDRLRKYVESRDDVDDRRSVGSSDSLELTFGDRGDSVATYA